MTSSAPMFAKIFGYGLQPCFPTGAIWQLRDSLLRRSCSPRVLRIDADGQKS